MRKSHVVTSLRLIYLTYLNSILDIKREKHNYKSVRIFFSREELHHASGKFTFQTIKLNESGCWMIVFSVVLSGELRSDHEKTQKRETFLH